MEKIAIMVSTAPLRKTTTRHGITKQRLNQDVCHELARTFDVIIIGSLSADEVFHYIERHLVPEFRPKFRLYPRSFFHALRTQENLELADDPRNTGWQQILAVNGIEFMAERPAEGDDDRALPQKFSWERMTDFITDSRVVLVSGAEGQLFFSAPVAAER